MNDLLRPALYQACHPDRTRRPAPEHRGSRPTSSARSARPATASSRDGDDRAAATRATSSRSATPAPTASRCRRTTTSARGRPRCSSRTARLGSSAGARPTRISCGSSAGAKRPLECRADAPSTNLARARPSPLFLAAAFALRPAARAAAVLRARAARITRSRRTSLLGKNERDVRIEDTQRQRHDLPRGPAARGAREQRPRPEVDVERARDRGVDRPRVGPRRLHRRLLGRRAPHGTGANPKVFLVAETSGRSPAREPGPGAPDRLRRQGPFGLRSRARSS